MKRLGFSLLVLGALILVSGLLATNVASAAPVTPNPAPILARVPPQGATYVGSTTCFTCHNTSYRDWSMTYHSKMIQDVSVDAKVIIADFKAGEEVRQAEIGGAKRAYTDKDVAFTIGSKSRQRFIMKTDKGYQVLPGQWNVAEKKWAEAPAADWVNECAGCHTTGFNVEKGTWAELSVSCESCHGPASVHVEKAKALPANTKPVSDEVYAVCEAIVKTVDSAVCGSCHSVGTSPDGKHQYAVGYLPGMPLDDKVYKLATATKKADDPFFWADGTEKAYRAQYNVFATTKHGGNALKEIKDAKGGDNCLGCHSTDFAHQDKTFAKDVVTIDNAQFSITCVQCHTPHGGGTASRQLSDQAYDLCVSCHNGTSLGKRAITAGGEVHHPMREMFEGTAFLGMKAMPSPHFSNETNGPVCSTCHMVKTGTAALSGDVATHSFKVIIPGTGEKDQKDSCTTCHSLEKNKDNTPANLANTIKKIQTDTQKRIEGLKDDLAAILKQNAKWDLKAKPADKPKEQLDYERAVTLVSFVESDGSKGFHNPAYADAILKAAEKIVDALLK